MDYFQHRPAFVRAALGTVFQDINEERQVTGFLRIWNATAELADRIGKNTNDYVLPCKAGGITIRIGKNDLVAFRVHAPRSGHGAIDRDRRIKAYNVLHIHEMVDRQESRYLVQVRMHPDHAHAHPLERSH